MRGVNLAIILGRTGGDPEVRSTPDGQTVVNVSVATSEKWKDKNTGQPVEKTEWHRVSAFGKTADVIAQYVKKGSLIHVEGKIQTDSWQDQNGQKKYSTKIVANRVTLLDSNNATQGQQQQQYQQSTQQQFQQPQQYTPNPHQQWSQ